MDNKQKRIIAGIGALVIAVIGAICIFAKKSND